MSLTCSNRDLRYIQLAGYEATKSIVGYKHGCVAVVSGKIVARGFNNYRTHSKDGLIAHACSCHAEIDVLRKCRKQNITKKITLYVARVTNSNTLDCSQPCVDCYTKMQSFEIKRLIYSDHHGEIVKSDMIDFSSTFTTSGQNAIRQKRVRLLGMSQT